MSQTASHWHFNFFIPANANRKSFKSSVKPGWYYFGRKMVRERWSFSLFTSSCHLPFTFSSPGHGRFWVGHVVFNFQRAHPVCSFRAHTVCQNLLHVGSTGASDDTVKYGHVSWALWCCGDIYCSCSSQYRSLVYMVYGLLAVWTSMGWTYVTLMLSHCILLYSISLVKIRWLCFATGLFTLATFKCQPFVAWQVNRKKKKQPKKQKHTVVLK